MADSEPLTISCGPHGEERIAAVVCRHMVGRESSGAGFVENSSDPNDLQAWCHACEEKFQAEGGMTEAFREFTGMSIVCVDCYADAKARHSLPSN